MMERGFDGSLKFTSSQLRLSIPPEVKWKTGKLALKSQGIFFTLTSRSIFLATAAAPREKITKQHERERKQRTCVDGGRQMLYISDVTASVADDDLCSWNMQIFVSAFSQQKREAKINISVM